MLEFRRWLILVGLNAPASFMAAILTDHSTLVDLVEMILGIVTFVFVALAIDGWIRNRGYLQLRESLVKATKIKIGLQLIPAIEVGAGVVAAGFVGFFFPLEPVGGAKAHHLGETYLMTVTTGAVLSLVVFLITAIHLYFRSIRRN